MAFKFCPECGFKFDKDYKFCPECGYKLDGAAEEKKPEPLFDFSEDTAKYDDERFGGFDEQLKKQEELKKKEEELNEREAQLKKEEAEKEKAAKKKTAPAPKKVEPVKKTMPSPVISSTAVKKQPQRTPTELANAIYQYRWNKYDDCVPVFKKYAEAGNAEAQTFYALCFKYGYGVRKDIETAYEWFVKAAEQGDAFAMSHIASIYDRASYGIQPSDPTKNAKYWYLKAAELGDLGAKNKCKSKKWLK